MNEQPTSKGRVNISIAKFQKLTEAKLKSQSSQQSTVCNTKKFDEDDPEVIVVDDSDSSHTDDSDRNSNSNSNSNNDTRENYFPPASECVIRHPNRGYVCCIFRTAVQEKNRLL